LRTDQTDLLSLFYPYLTLTTLLDTMRFILLLGVLLITSTALSQHSEVRFREETFANGMNYPQVIIPSCKNCEDSINTNFKQRIADLEASDFCIGQYGYVQKSTHLQIHLFCNCIDFEESQNRFFLYNLEEGKAVPYSDLMDPKKRSESTAFLSNLISQHLESKSIVVQGDFMTNLDQQGLDACKVEMTKDGLKIWEEGNKQWEAAPYVATWLELKPFLKYHFI